MTLVPSFRVYPARQYCFKVPGFGRSLLSVALYLLLRGREFPLVLTDARSIFQARPLGRFVLFAMAFISFQDLDFSRIILRERANFLFYECPLSPVGTSPKVTRAFRLY